MLGRRFLLGNDQVAMAFATASESSPLYRNATGDELVYVQSGELVLESVFGRMAVHDGDYVVVPSSTTFSSARAKPGRSLRATSSMTPSTPITGVGRIGRSPVWL